jgi:hypothetical protein
MPCCVVARFWGRKILHVSLIYRVIRQQPLRVCVCVCVCARARAAPAGSLHLAALCNETTITVVLLDGEQCLFSENK